MRLQNTANDNGTESVADAPPITEVPQNSPLTGNSETTNPLSQAAPENQQACAKNGVPDPVFARLDPSHTVGATAYQSPYTGGVRSTAGDTYSTAMVMQPQGHPDMGQYRMSHGAG